MKHITQDRLKELLQYNKCTGEFLWRVPRRGKAKKGAVAGHVDKSSGYVRLRIDGRLYRAHRLVWIYHYGIDAPHEIDHINHKRHDNRIENLQAATSQENSCNTILLKRNTSGVVGVGWKTKINKWVASITHKGKTSHLGCFVNKEEAIYRRKKAEEELGFHYNHGK